MSKKFATTFVCGVLLTITGSALARELSVGDMHKVAVIATNTFKADYTAPMYNSIKSIKTTKSKNGDEAVVVLGYTSNGTATTIEYTCHVHEHDHKDSELDCHEH